MRFGREAWILLALLLVFVSASVYYTQRGFESQRRAQPTTFSTGADGLGVLFRLFRKENLIASRLIKPLTSVPENAGLLVISQPFQREFAAEELHAVNDWVDSGGALLIIVSDPFQSGPFSEILKNHVKVVPAQSASSKEISPAKQDSPYLQDVAKVGIDGLIHLTPEPKSEVKTLIGDNAGAYAVTWEQDEGNVIVVTDGVGIDNGRIARADNALFFVNIAASHCEKDHLQVVFDEYHQGFGSEEAGLSIWQAIGAPAHAVAWFLLAGFLIILYNANVRFGPVKHLEIPEYRPSTEYVTSMAGLYRRANSADIAIETIYKAFSHDLLRGLDAPPEAESARVAELAERKFGWKQGPIRDLMARCESIVDGRKPSDGEMMELAKMMDDYRRKADLVRIA